MGKNINIHDEYGQVVRRVKLPEARWSARCSQRVEIGTGLFLTGIYVGRKNVLIETTSIWTTREGGTVGAQYRLADVGDLEMIERYCGNAVSADVENALKVQIEPL